MATLQPYGDDARVRLWLEIREPLERQLAPLGQAVMAAIRPLPGERVLDIGCGIGTTPLALAQAVGPGGEVVGIDLLAAAVKVVRSDPGLPENVSFLAGDVQTYPFVPGSFDVAFSRFGVMFFADPVAAFGNIRRALRPGGRFGFVCWRSLGENELDAWPLRAASACLPAGLALSAAAADCFSLSHPARLRQVLTQAGFAEVDITPHDQPVRCGDLRSTVRVCSRVGMLGKILREHPAYRDDAARELEQALMPLDGPGGPALRAATWVVTARAP